MSNLSEKYSKILKDVDEHIVDEKEKRYVTSKIDEISALFMELFDKVSSMNDEKLENLEKQQERMIATISKLQESVDLIKNDIYEEDSYDFEIVCPYCNHEFVADVESELKEEVECPECHNMIELNWDEEEETHSCGGCSESHDGHCSGHCDSKHHEDNDEDM